MDNKIMIMALLPYGLVLIIVLGVWGLAIYRAFKLPDGSKVLMSFILKALMVGGVISVLLAGYMDSNTPGDYGSLGLLLGGIVGVVGTFAVAGFILLSRINKALRLYKESDAYKSNSTNSKVLDEL